jgi:sodium/hydrogen antiporter
MPAVLEPELNVAAVAVVSACVIIWGLVSARLERWDITAPMAFVVLGVAVTNGASPLIHVHLRSSDVQTLAEVTLAVVLFADASRVNARALRTEAALPTRLLCVGLPFTIGLGTVAAFGLFPGAGWWLAATIGAILAPTDAALGSSILQDERIPIAVRRTLNVESGMNDGIATPFVNLFLAGALASETVHFAGVGQAAVDLIGGATLGAAIGLVGALLIHLSLRAGWSTPGFRSLSILALAVFAYATALLAGVNGFVATFLAGLAFGTVVAEDDLLGFAEEAGTLLSLLVWFFFGAVMVVPGFQAASWRDVIFALLALTVVRMGPVALALAGSGCDRSTVAFIGWFGPRGLASVVFGLIATDTLLPADGDLVLGAVTVTVTMSVLLHGVSASPLARRYAQIVEGLPPGPEHRLVEPVTTRKLAGGARFLGPEAKS